MSARDSHAFHISNLIEQEPDAQVVSLYYAEKLEAEINELKAENERLKETLKRSLETLKESNISGIIKDTIWYSDCETLFDFMQFRLEQ